MNKSLKIMRRWKNPLISVLQKNVIYCHQIKKYCVLVYTSESRPQKMTINIICIQELVQMDNSYIEKVYLKVSYAPVGSIKFLQNIIPIESAEGAITFILDISNAYQNNIIPSPRSAYDPKIKCIQNYILPNPEEIVYLSLPCIHLEWFKIKWPKYPLVKNNTKEPCIQ